MKNEIPLPRTNMTTSRVSFHLDRRAKALIAVSLCIALFAALFIGSKWAHDAGVTTHLATRKLPPSWEHLFGTDWLGRDMFARTIKGLRISLGVGLIAATCSSLIALVLGLMAATAGTVADRIITWLVDVAIATPHLVLLILISFACGGGSTGVIIAVAASHWPNLTRVIRAEVMQLRTSQYVQLSRRLGKGPFFIATKHMLPHIVPQFIVGLLLLFPHAILHAASLTFLGFGMSPHSPAIGVLLAESMRSLSMGLWWLAVFPGLCLVLTVKTFDILGNNIRALLDPRTCRE